MPYLVFAVICFVITLVGAFRIQQIFVSSKKVSSVSLFYPSSTTSGLNSSISIRETELWSSESKDTSFPSAVSFKENEFDEYSSEIRDLPHWIKPDDDYFISDEPNESKVNSGDLTTAIHSTSRERIKSELNMMAVFRRVLKQTWKYNGHAITFILVFCLTTFFIAPLLYRLYYVDFDKFLNSTNDFILCLLLASATAPIQDQLSVNSYAKDVCGSVPSQRASVLELRVLMGWACAYGIIPSVLFFDLKAFRQQIYFAIEFFKTKFVYCFESNDDYVDM